MNTAPRGADTTAEGTGRSGGQPLVALSGGTVTVDVPAIPTTLNPHTVAGENPATEMVSSLIWPECYDLAPDLSPEPAGSAILSAETGPAPPAGPLVVTYHINPAAVWSDGVPISAQDFVYAWTSQRGDGKDVDGRPDSVASTMGYEDIASVVGSSDGKTVTVTFRSGAAYADWPSLFNDLIPAHVAEFAGWNNGFDHFNPQVLVSGGPWMVESWQPGVQMTLVPNPRWWGPPLHLSRLILVAVASPAQQGADVANNAAQVAMPPGFDAPLVAAVSSSPRLFSYDDPGTTTLEMEMNTAAVPFDDVSVRQAVAHLVDRTELAATVLDQLGPGGVAQNHLFVSSEQGYVNDGSDYSSADPAASARLLEGVGFVPGPNGTWTLNKSPVTIQLTWPSDDPFAAATGPALAAALVAGGFDVASDPVPTSTLLGSLLPSGSFDIALVPVPTSAYTSRMESVFSPGLGTFISPAMADWSRFDDPKVDAMFGAAEQELNGAVAQSDYQAIDRQLWIDMPTLPLFTEPSLVVVDANLEGVVDDDGGPNPVWHTTSWVLMGSSPGATSNEPGQMASS